MDSRGNKETKGISRRGLILGATACCDNDAGAAIATGTDVLMMRFLPASHAVKRMRAGAAPADAVRYALRSAGGEDAVLVAG